MTGVLNCPPFVLSRRRLSGHLARPPRQSEPFCLASCGNLKQTSLTVCSHRPQKVGRRLLCLRISRLMGLCAVMVWSAPAGGFEVLPRPGELTFCGRRRPTPTAQSEKVTQLKKKQEEREREKKEGRRRRKPLRRRRRLGPCTL